MKLLMLRLPFIVSNLIALEANAMYPLHTRLMPSISYSNPWSIVAGHSHQCNAAVDWARPGSRLHCLAHVSDPSDEVVELLINSWSGILAVVGVNSKMLTLLACKKWLWISWA